MLGFMLDKNIYYFLHRIYLKWLFVSALNQHLYDFIFVFINRIKRETPAKLFVSGIFFEVNIDLSTAVL